MTGRSAVGPATQSAAAGVARQIRPTPKLSSRVRGLGNISNGPGLIRRRDAEFFLANGRADYIGPDQDGHDLIRLIRSHPMNLAAEARVIRECDASIEDHRGGPIILWNVSKSSRKSRRPGDVVS